MAQLSEYRRELILSILERIRKCEGGTIDTYTAEDDSFIIRLTPDIPPRLWCDVCKKRAICKTKLMARWTRVSMTY